MEMVLVKAFKVGDLIIVKTHGEIHGEIGGGALI
jgi:hypothetical protein